ncbi:MAG: translation initiation factor IF-2 N-terminal domain-containing protein [Gemmataceae bacterium]
MEGRIRIYQLACKLNVDTKQILSLCESSGFYAKNSVSTLNPEESRLIETLIRRNNPGDDTSPAFVPVWKPPPTDRWSIGLKPDSDKY